MTSADYLQVHNIPQLSPSSTSAALSDSAAYPYFARMPPSDVWQSFALADVVEHLLGVERVATVHSEDAYGALGMQAFENEAVRRGLRVLASTSFANFQEDLSSSVDVLRRSGALVVVLFCQTADASRFIQAMQAAGGENITYVGSEAVTPAVRSMVTSSPDQAARLRGFVGMGLSGGTGDEHAAFQLRLGAFQATVFGDGWCSNATDDDGQLLWAAADGGCPWAGGNATLDFYAPFAYDAVYAMAYAMNRTMPSTPHDAVYATARAMNRTLSTSPNAPLDGISLMAQLLSTNFTGASGRVDFDENGDRTTGVSYDVYNMADQGMTLLGQWQQGSTWAARFSPGSLASYVSADGSGRAPELASNGMFLRLGVVCEDAQSDVSNVREDCDHVQHAVDRINDKTDGWLDDLLPNRTIVTSTRSAKCVPGEARSAWLELQDSLPGFTAVLGPKCSDSVAEVSGLTWRNSTGNRAVVISPQSLAHELADGVAYPNLARSVTPSQHGIFAMLELFMTLGWDRVAILYDDSFAAEGGVALFQHLFKARGGEVLEGGLIQFSLADFDNGTVHVRELLSRLDDAGARTIILVTQPSRGVQRAVFAWAYEHKILYGPGYGWFNTWFTEVALHNDDGSVNTSAVLGAEGMIGLTNPDIADDTLLGQRMVELWRGASSSNCQGRVYCDADGDPATWTNLSPSIVDAVLLYAHAMDALQRTAPQSMEDPDALYEAMLQLPAFDGLAGPFTLNPDGDRLGRSMLINLQICSGGDNCARRRRLDSSSISLAQTSASTVEVGVYDALTRNLTVRARLFPLTCTCW